MKKQIFLILFCLLVLVSIQQSFATQLQDNEEIVEEQDVEDDEDDDEDDENVSTLQNRCIQHGINGTCKPLGTDCEFGTIAQVFSTPSGINYYDCLPCQNGTYFQNGTSFRNNGCLPCPAGTFSIAGSIGRNSCVPCPQGYFSPYEINRNIRSYQEIIMYQRNSFELYYDIRGTFTRNRPVFRRGQNVTIFPTPCVSCSNYAFIISSASIELGHYSDSVGSTMCKACPEGLATNSSMTGCSKCPANTYVRYGFCEKCPVGQTSLPGSVKCEPCAANTFFNGSLCLPCPKNTFSLPDSTNCITANSGEYLALKDRKTISLPCPRNTFSAGGNATVCKGCPPGTATMFTRSSWCLRCGLVEVDPGTTIFDIPSCRECKSGTYLELNEQQNSYSCVNCPGGTYSRKANLFSVSECIECPSHTYGAAPGINTVEGCVDYKNCPENKTPQRNKYRECVPCPPNSVSNSRTRASNNYSCVCKSGYYENAETKNCEPCPSGLLSIEGSTSIQQCFCPSNTYKQTIDGRDTCVACPKLHTSNFNSTSLSQCKYVGCPPPLLDVNSNCVCPANTYGEKCFNCPGGQTSAIGSTKKDDCKCPRNTYKPAPEDDNCSACPPRHVSHEGSIYITKCLKI